MVNMLKTSFKTRPYEDRIKIKLLGLDRPDLHLTQTVNKVEVKWLIQNLTKTGIIRNIGCAVLKSLFCCLYIMICGQKMVLKTFNI